MIAAGVAIRCIAQLPAMAQIFYIAGFRALAHILICALSGTSISQLAQ